VFVDGIDGWSVVIAAGPFSTSDNILYEPLNDLINCLNSEAPPDICILVCAVYHVILYLFEIAVDKLQLLTIIHKMNRGEIKFETMVVESVWLSFILRLRVSDEEQAEISSYPVADWV